jgi:heat shock protein HslJ
VASYADASGATQQALPDVETLIVFKDGTVAGTAGCNRLSGSYQVDGSNVKFGPMASTMMACPEAPMAQEAAVMAAMSSAATYELTGDQLILKDASGKVVLTLAKAQSVSLTGQPWSAIAINNGKQAVTGVIAGSEVTAVFGDDGIVSGSSGCNTYTGQYTVDGTNIKIGPLASTRMMCADEQVMQQEQAFLNAMANAATYTIELSQLELFAADGARQVTFEAAK